MRNPSNPFPFSRAFGYPAATLAWFLAAAAPLRAGPVIPQVSGSGYAFAFPSSGPRLEVEPSIGARLSSLKLGAIEFLFVDRAGINWGATFWPSPQSVWAWPPPEALDRSPYAGGPQGGILALAGAQDPATRLSFAKRFSAEDADTSFRLGFAMLNGSASPKPVAPWMVTRVLPGGLTFFAKGRIAGHGDLAPQVKEASGWMWFDHGAAVLPAGSPKYYADGAGWMAHVDRNGLLLLETFRDIDPAEAAPDEAEIEIYADPAGKYMEIEHQGAYASIPPGDSAAWTTRWYLRRLPDGVERKAGDPRLMALVADLLRRASTGLAEPPANRRPQPKGFRPRVGIFQSERRNPRPVDAGGRAIP